MGGNNRGKMIIGEKKSNRRREGKMIIGEKRKMIKRGKENNRKNGKIDRRGNYMQEENNKRGEEK